MAAALIKLAQCVSFTAGALRLTSARGQFVNMLITKLRAAAVNPSCGGQSFLSADFIFHTHGNIGSRPYFTRAREMHLLVSENV